MKTLEVGTKVRRGRDWKWEDQDGGDGKTGIVIGPHGTSKQWVNVKWYGSGTTIAYRWGALGFYDLKLAE